MSAKSIWRKDTYLALSRMSFDGKVLDIGGSSKAGYLSLLQGKHTVDINNIDESYGRTLSFDLEKPWPVKNESYEAVLAINILEHLFDYRHALKESHRVLRPAGKIVIAVPFLIAYHPCPHDYWRFTEETLQRILLEAGFKNIVIMSAGTGMMSAATNLKHNALQKVSFVCTLFQAIAQYADRILSLSRKGKHFSAKYYPLGYIVTAEK